MLNMLLKSNFNRLLKSTLTRLLYGAHLTGYYTVEHAYQVIIEFQEQRKKANTLGPKYHDTFPLIIQILH